MIARFLVAWSEKQKEFPEVELSHETERAVAWLRSQCPVNPELEKHLVGYAKLTGLDSFGKR